MKKLLSLILALVMVSSLLSCGSGKNIPADTFTPPREPEGFLDGYAELGVSTADASALFSVLHSSGLFTISRYAQDYVTYYHGGSNAWSTALALDPNGRSALYMRTHESSVGTVKTSYKLEQDGTSVFLRSEMLKPEISRNPFNEKEEFKDKYELISHYTGEKTVGSALALVGDVTAGRKLDEERIKAALAFSADGEDSVDPTGKLRTVSATFTCEELSNMLAGFKEKEQLSDEMIDFWASFFSDGEFAPLADKIRAKGDFSLSLRITADAKTDRVQLADITAKGDGTLASIVYDGTTGSLEVVAERENAHGESSARYATEYADGRAAAELSAYREEACGCFDGTSAHSKEIIYLLGDGTVYFSSEESTVETHPKAYSHEDKETKLTSSIKFDSNTDTYTLTGGEIQIKLKANNGTLTGEIKNTKTGTVATLIFETEKTDSGRVHTLKKIKTSGGEKDVSAAGVKFRYSNIGM